MGLRALVILFIIGFVAIVTLGAPYFGALTYLLLGYIRPTRLSYGQVDVFKPYLVLYIIICAAYFFRNKKTIHLKYNRAFIMLLLVALFATISSFNAVLNPTISFYWSNNLLKIVFMAWMVRVLMVEKGSHWSYLATIIAGASFIGIWSFEQHFRGNIRLEQVAGGNFNDSNSIGMLMVQTLPLLVYFAFFKTPISNQKFLRILYAILSLVFASVIVFTESRAAFLGFFVTVFIFWFGLSMRHKMIGLAVVVLILPLAISVTSRVEGYNAKVQITSMEENAGGRFIIWTAAYETFKDYPLTGVGQQNFQYIAKNYTQAIGEHSERFERVDAHNTYMLFAAEGGIGQVTAYLFLILFSLLDCIALIKKYKNNHQEQYLVKAIFASVFGVIVVSMFHSYPAHENILLFLILPECIRNIKYNEEI